MGALNPRLGKKRVMAGDNLAFRENTGLPAHAEAPFACGENLLSHRAQELKLAWRAFVDQQRICIVGFIFQKCAMDASDLSRDLSRDTETVQLLYRLAFIEGSDCDCNAFSRAQIPFRISAHRSDCRVNPLAVACSQPLTGIRRYQSIAFSYRANSTMMRLP
jgi:hypothetical protein